MTLTTIAAVGDSTTGPYLTHLPDDVTRVAGWNQGGATTAQMLAALPTTPVPADVAVVMGGINDLRLGAASRAQILDNLVQVAQALACPHVLLLATAPSDVTDYTRPDGSTVDRQREQAILNRSLVSWALGRGWAVVDPWAPHRTLAGGWSAGTTTDGVHPTTAAAQSAAALIAAAAHIAHTGAAGSTP